MGNCVYVHKGIQLKSRLQHWDLIGCMTAPPPVLSASNIFPPLSSHCACIIAMKILARV
jgi:hypothetical protein